MSSSSYSWSHSIKILEKSLHLVIIAILCACVSAVARSCPRSCCEADLNTGCPKEACKSNFKCKEFWDRKVEKVKKLKAIDHNFDVCLVAPCTQKHVPLLIDLLYSVNQQDLLPRKIVIPVSEVSVKYCAFVLSHLQHYTQVPIVMNCTARYQSPGSNRNRGAQLCDEGVISFIDADDIMHPKRLSTLVQLLRDHDADAALHFTTSPALANAPMADSRVMVAKQLERIHRTHCSSKRKKKTLALLPLGLCHGHMTVRASIAKAFSKHPPITYGEDALYLRHLIEHGLKIVATSQNLSVYRIGYESWGTHPWQDYRCRHSISENGNHDCSAEQKTWKDFIAPTRWEKELHWFKVSRKAWSLQLNCERDNCDLLL